MRRTLETCRLALCSLIALAAAARDADAGLLVPNGNPTGGPTAGPGTTGGKTTLGPSPAVFMPMGSCPWLLPALNAQGFLTKNITFKTLAGNIQMDTYAPWVDSAPKVVEGNITVAKTNDPGLGGAVIGLHYLPKGTDPTGNDVHWIQVIRTNAPLAPEITYGYKAAPGVYYAIDDLLPNQNVKPTNPFYDDLNNADSTDFVDNPARGFTKGLDGNPITFQAQVFLATGNLNATDPSKSTLTIYDGVWWGFGNSIVATPEPSTLALASLGALTLAVYARRCARRPPAGA